jgi:hypothetical protein
MGRQSGLPSESRSKMGSQNQRNRGKRNKKKLTYPMTKLFRTKEEDHKNHARNPFRK